MGVKEKVRQVMATAKDCAPIGEAARQIKAGNDTRKAVGAAALALADRLRTAVRSKDRRTALVAVADEFAADPAKARTAKDIRDATSLLEGDHEYIGLRTLQYIARDLESWARAHASVEDMYAGHPYAVEPTGTQARPEGYDSGRSYNWRDVETRGYR